MALIGMPRIEGERYQATIPDTLDLADRTELALNGLGGFAQSRVGLRELLLDPLQCESSLHVSLGIRSHKRAEVR